MTEIADFVVLEGGAVAAPVAADGAPTLTVDLTLGGAEARPIRLPVTEAAVGQLVDVLHRLGGQQLVAELGHALDDLVRDSPRFADATLASQAIRLLEQASVTLRGESITYLEALDTSLRRAFERDLTSAMAELRPERFGMEIDQDAKVTVPGRSKEEPDEPTDYEVLRDFVQALDALRRLVKQWAFPIPKNAAQARRQFEQSALGPFTELLDAATQWRPAMVVLGPRLLKELEGQSRRDIGTWADEDSTSTPLDTIIQDTLVEAFLELREEQPAYRDTVLKEADKALGVARSMVGRYWEETPGAAMGRRHPLCRHAFVLQAAVEEQGYRPGDHGYAVAVEAGDAATSEQGRERRAAAELDRMLGWSALGFGVLALVPVVGQLALVAAIAVSAIT
ncbi:MAG TPA: hypothetical protein PL137_04290, partial [Nocardioides sp.]|nr:hypothetical protein [Nocardioides sp.]